MGGFEPMTLPSVMVKMELMKTGKDQCGSSSLKLAQKYR